jgi:hypothetical protein
MKKILLFALLATGCGGASTPTPTPTPQLVPDAIVTGQYSLVLTSTNGHGTTNVYTNFTQAAKTFTGAANTLVCPLNDVLQCNGNDAQATSISPTGTVSGANVTIMISFPTAAGADTVSMVGTAAGANPVNLAGTYTDSQGDAGNWTGSPVGFYSGSYSGTFNLTVDPLPIAPTILLTLTQNDSFNLTGTAMITSLPCINSLTLSGQAIGGAFSLTDTANKAHITAVPTASNFTFSYHFDTTAPSCAGDFGQGALTPPNPWDY